jgi:hypothetical protein
MEKPSTLGGTDAHASKRAKRGAASFVVVFGKVGPAAKERGPQDDKLLGAEQKVSSKSFTSRRTEARLLLGLAGRGEKWGTHLPEAVGLSAGVRHPPPALLRLER